jgi:hypothetical protein
MLALGLDVATVVAVAGANRALPLTAADPGALLPADDRWLSDAVMTAVKAFLRYEMDDTDRLAVGAHNIADRPVAEYEVAAWRGTASSLALAASFIVDPQVIVESETLERGERHQRKAHTHRAE